MTLDLSSLNGNQLEAVNWQDSPLLVLAGPGSGKTRVLTYRIARIISETPNQHFVFLALTFTNKAAAEMKERLLQLVPNVSDRVEVTTFHSFAANLLRQHGSHIGLRPNFTILNQEEDQKIILQQVLSKHDIENNYSPEKLLPAINSLLRKGVLAEEAKSILVQYKLKEEQAETLSKIYLAYCLKSIQDNCLDFGNLLIQATTLLKSKPFIQQSLYRIYSYICIDEFQDTNQSQYNFLKLVVNPEYRNLFIVGDDDQTMYQWNGAHPKRFDQLKEDYLPKIIQLPQNYRCPSQIVKAANKLICHNQTHLKDKELLIPNKQPNNINPIRLKYFDNFNEEAKWIAKDIAESNKQNCTILARSKKMLEEVVEELKELDVPVHLHIRKDEFESSPLIWLHSMLRLANTRNDKKQLYRICKSFYDLEGIKTEPEKIVESVTVACNDDYLRAWYELVKKRDNQLSIPAKQIFETVIPKLIDKLDFYPFIKKAFSYFDSLNNQTTELADYTEEKKTWQELQIEIENQYGFDQITLYLLLQEIDLRSKNLPPKNAIPCYTIHASKGMEFKHVYLAGLVEEHFPSWQAVKKGDSSHEMEEERRNCFVAITRTVETLTLTYSKNVFGWEKEPSRFLKEMELLPLP
jgi:DNA helicase-2/ATP-dependent DNA helicase PcrA